MLLLNCPSILNGSGLCGRKGAGMFHTKVNAIALLRFVDKEIFQGVLPVCRSERFFADPAIYQSARNLLLQSHANKFVA
jgi:hypothetical protein